MRSYFKKFTVIIITLFLIIGYSNISIATDHTTEDQVINQLKKDIYDLGEIPEKKNIPIQKNN